MPNDINDNLPDNRPWVPRPFPSWLIQELNRRRDDIGINYVKNAQGTWNDNGNWNTYKGPMMPWVRFCSNGDGKSKFLAAFKGNTINKGFVLYGGNGFEDVYGVNEKKKNVLGYDVLGNPHQLPLEGSGFNYTLSNVSSSNAVTAPLYLPSPGIVSVDALVRKELIREITIKWNCYGFAQLEYMTPYFLTPAISATVEFGWNHFNPKSLLDLANEAKLKDLWSNGSPLYTENIKNSKGMYDVTFGLITNFEFSTTDGVKYDCSTTISSKHRNFSGVTFPTPESKDNEADDKKPEAKSGKIIEMTFPEFLDKRIKKVRDAYLNGKNFFEPLDSDEEKMNKKGDFGLNSANFYSGSAEDRVFFGRQDYSLASPTYGNGYPTKLMYTNYSPSTPRGGDWDEKSNDNIWVTGGFLIELCNYFITKESNLKTSEGKKFKYYQMNTEGNIIGGHPNLISADGLVLLIPNKNSPKYNLGVHFTDNDKDNTFMQQHFSKNNSSEVFSSYSKTIAEIIPNYGQSIEEYKKSEKPDTFSLPDVALWRTFVTLNNGQVAGRGGVARDNLDEIINVFRYTPDFSTKVNKKIKKGKGYYSFPQYIDVDKYNMDNKNVRVESGKFGFFEDLYINISAIINCAKDSKTTGEFWDKLFEKINDAVNGFWDLKIVESNDNLAIMDQKYISIKDVEQTPVYQFDIASSRNIIKSINFTSTISNVQANQVIAASTNNQKKEENSTSAPLDFVYGDRLFDGDGVDAKNTDSFMRNSKEIEALQKFGKSDEKVDGRFIMSFQSDSDASKGDYNIVTLALPNKALLSAIMTDGDVNGNPNVYSGQQPNFTIEMTLQGIAGFRTFQCFSFKNFPRPYSDRDVIFQIVDVSHTVTNNMWETKLKAGIRPLRVRKQIIFDDGDHKTTVKIN